MASDGSRVSKFSFETSWCTPKIEPSARHLPISGWCQALFLLFLPHPNDPSGYILRIECDSAMYHSSATAKERDVYRQKYLESRGGIFERIWSRNWWKNPSAEIERIDHKVKDFMKSEKIREQILVLEYRNIKKQLLVKEVRHYILIY